MTIGRWGAVPGPSRHEKPCGHRSTVLEMAPSRACLRRQRRPPPTRAIERLIALALTASVCRSRAVRRATFEICRGYRAAAQAGQTSCGTGAAWREALSSTATPNYPPPVPRRSPPTPSRGPSPPIRSQNAGGGGAKWRPPCPAAACRSAVGRLILVILLFPGVEVRSVGWYQFE